MIYFTQATAEGPVKIGFTRRTTTMNIETLDHAHGARPFRPFSLALPDGRTLAVPRPESVAHRPGSRLAVVLDGRDGYEAVDVAAVVSLNFEGETAS